jgi:hypothetical protein
MECYKLYNTKIRKICDILFGAEGVPLESITSEVSNDICFVTYTLYYVCQIDDLGIQLLKQYLAIS